jgi:hypothetical protein
LSRIYNAWRLFRLAVLRMLSAPRAELLQRDPIRIVALVFFRVVVALATVGARQCDQYAIGLFRHGPLCLLVEYSLECCGSRVAGAHGQDRTDDLTLTKGVLYH